MPVAAATVTTSVVVAIAATCGASNAPYVVVTVSAPLLLMARRMAMVWERGEANGGHDG
jgi:hypothetical protein